MRPFGIASPTPPVPISMPFLTEVPANSTNSNIAPNQTFGAPYRVSSCEENLKLQFKIFDLASVEMRRKENLILQLQEQVRLANNQIDNLQRQIRGFTRTPLPRVRFARAMSKYLI